MPVPILFFFAIYVSLCFLMMLKPTIFIGFNDKYFRCMFKMMGYTIELKPTSPGKPERVLRIWGLICLAIPTFFILFVV